MKAISTTAQTPSLPRGRAPTIEVTPDAAPVDLRAFARAYVATLLRLEGLQLRPERLADAS